jgi:ABC-type antimicrobial peptide transport system permease subunit
MFRNYFKIAWRNLLRQKGFSAINILGLATGMASAMLILLWIHNEVSFDKFHEKRERIFEAWNLVPRNGEIQAWNTTPKILAKTLQNDFPEVERTVRVNWPSNYLFSLGDKRLTVSGNIVDSGFLQVFSFPMLKGDPLTALNSVYSIVLTEKFAKKLFGDEDAMGKIVKLDNKDNFTVTGILKDLPTNTRFSFEYLLPWSYLRQQGGDDEYWGNNSTRTYVLLKPHATKASIDPKIKKLREKYDNDDPVGGFFLYPVDRWHLYSSFERGIEKGGRIELVRMFAIIAVFILLIACINFMNLSTAKSEKRSKEVGIRKVVGAQKKSIVGQFLGESVLLALIAGIFALIIVTISLPAFSQLTDRDFPVPYNEPWFWLAFLGFILITGIIAGSYPAFFLSSFKPVKVLKGSFKSGKALVTPRKVLVILQFTFAIVLIISTIIVRQQIQHAQNRQAGYDKNNLVYHFLTGDLEKNYMLVKNELLSSGIAEAVTKTSAPLTEGWSNTWGFVWKGKDPNDKTIINRFVADDGIVKTAGLQLAKGRDFDLSKFITDSSGMILNESAAKIMGLKDPIGETVRDGDQDYHVIGLIRDFVLQSPYHPTEPMAILGAKAWFNVIHIRFNNNRSTAENLKATERIFKKYNKEYPFEYHFVDEEYAKKFEDGQRIATLAGLFASLAIFISCLGLFGLAAYMAENRVKEIGVRKVLGATVTSITTLLSKDFLKLVIISICISSPLAWYAMHSWLKDFPYRIDISWWVFALAGILAIVVALTTVSFQAVKAALANPVKSLRTE